MIYNQNKREDIKMTVSEFKETFWRYYLILQERFDNSTRYIELCTDNFSTYSIDFVNQLQAIGTETEAIMKVMCGFNATDRKNIYDYAVNLLATYPTLTNWEIKTRDITLKPFDGWTQTNAATSLPWWNAYNNIKHSRNANFKDASLENTLYALMGLYLLEMIYFKKIADYENKPDILPNSSNLFSIVNWNNRYNSFSNVVYEFEDGVLKTFS